MQDNQYDTLHKGKGLGRFKVTGQRERERKEAHIARSHCRSFLYEIRHRSFGRLCMTIAFRNFSTAFVAFSCDVLCGKKSRMVSTDICRWSKGARVDASDCLSALCRGQEHKMCRRVCPLRQVYHRERCPPFQSEMYQTLWNSATLSYKRQNGAASPRCSEAA